MYSVFLLSNLGLSYTSMKKKIKQLLCINNFTEKEKHVTN